MHGSALADTVAIVKSLRSRLFVVWLLSLGAACAVGWLMLLLYRQSTAAQIGRAIAAVGLACERIADSYGFYAAGWAGPTQGVADETLARDLTALVQVALAASPGVEGGIWQQEAGPLAYAFPTYSGTGPKTDLPLAERPRIAAVNATVAQTDRPATVTYGTAAETLVLHACPLRGPIAELTGWAMMRVVATAGWDALRLGLGVLLALVLGIAAWLTALVLAWTRHVGRIEAALAGSDAGELPVLPRTGEKELDRIVAALNVAGRRLAEAHRQSAELAARVAQAERLAALGRIAAGVAHEFRNPIAVMRLRAENALAGDASRSPAALRAILAQIGRLDRLIAELLAMTQRRSPVPEPVNIAALLEAAAAEYGNEPVTVTVQAPATVVNLDPTLLRRALDVLLDNARRHTPPGGRVSISAALADGILYIEVADTGPGVAPELRETLFEPFVTSRAEGTGLGLAIARELAEALGGRLVLARPGGDRPGEGAVFMLEVPCQPC